MSKPDPDKAFTGTIAQVYQQHLVPLIFEPYAGDLVSRLQARPLSRVLEVAAGTGVVTRILASRLPQSVSIVATDLNPAMLEEAAKAGTCRVVDWRQANARIAPGRGNASRDRSHRGPLRSGPCRRHDPRACGRDRALIPGRRPCVRVPDPAGRQRSCLRHTLASQGCCSRGAPSGR